MTLAKPETHAPSHSGAPVVQASGPQSDRDSVWSTIQFVLSLLLTSGVLIYLLFVPVAAPRDRQRPSSSPPVVDIAGERLLQVTPGSPFDDKLQQVTAHTARLTNPVLTVTGRVAASLRPGNERGKDFWQFEAPEVLSSYSDWEKATADIVFTQTQLERVKQLAAARVESQEKVVARLKKLVQSGTDSPKDLAVEETNLQQLQITTQKEIYEAESAVKIARRSEAVTSRQLQQVGLEPALIRSVTSDVDIVMADVPEGRLTQVKVGQECICHFFGLPHENFVGKVKSIAPVLSKERRSLRVLLVIDDHEDQLRPGMFAEIGLGTDAREALLMPADGVLHIARTDYVLVAAGENLWRVTEVQVGEPHNGEVEILEGLKPGDKVLGKGAILLKPMVIRSLSVHAPSQSSPSVVTPSAGTNP